MKKEVTRVRQRWKRQEGNEIWVRGWEGKQQRDRELFCST
jgi:hypothetical protein